jgi:hypothetical protein
MHWSLPAFAASAAAVLIGTIAVSPVLNPTTEQLANRAKIKAEAELAQQLILQPPTEADVIAASRRAGH